MTHNLVFELFDGNATVCTDPRSALAITNGRFDVPNLFSGNGCLIDQLLATKASLSVRITVENQLLSPAQPLGTVPYAARARVAESAEAVSAAPDFVALQNRVAAVEARLASGGKYNLDATYCGATAPTTGAVGGYVAANALCQTACGNKPSAHVCTGQELYRAVVLTGNPGVTGRYATAISYAGILVDDCVSFTSGTGSHTSEIWNFNNVSGAYSNDYCTVSYPFLCCN